MYTLLSSVSYYAAILRLLWFATAFDKRFDDAIGFAGLGDPKTEKVKRLGIVYSSL